MKTLLIGILSICAWALPCQAQISPQAEQFYQSGQYAKALAVYEQDLKNYPNDPFLYYNIGNCYFKMGSNGLAVANYYRAFELNPRDSDIRHNLALALSASGDSLVPAGMPESLHQAVFALSLTELKGLVSLCGWLFCLLAGGWLLTRKAGKLTLAAAILLLVASGWCWLRHSWQREPVAVVATPQAELRSGPGDNFPASATVAQGHLVTVLDQTGNWQQVVLRKEGLKGWIENSSLEHI